MSVEIRPFRARDAIELALQPSQWIEAGIECRAMDEAQALALEQSGPAWSAIGDDGRVLVCAGFGTMYFDSDCRPAHGVAWAMLTTGIGAAHVAITRHARRMIAQSPLRRIEAIVKADDEGDACRWARMVGLEMACVLRGYGADGTTHFLFERVR